MNNILTAETRLGECPTFCSGGHIPADDGVVHISVDKQLAVSAGGESHTLYVSIEQVDGSPQEPPAIRLQGASDTPMSPTQALQLAGLLVAEAFAAVSSWQVSR